MPFLLHKAKNVCKSVAREMVKTTQESPKPCDMIAIYAYWMPNICLKKILFYDTNKKMKEKS